MAKHVCFRHVELEEKPNKKTKKGGVKGSVAILLESIESGCVSQDSYPRKSLLREPGNWDRNTASNSPRAPGTKLKSGERNCPSRGIIQKCAPHERSPCAPKFEERSHEDTSYQERCARKAAWDLAKNIYKLKMLKKLAQRSCVSQDPHSKKSVLRKDGQKGTNYKIQFSRCTWHNIKIQERKGPSLGIIQKCAPHERSPCVAVQNFRKGHKEDTLQQERCARKVALEPGYFLQAQEFGQNYVFIFLLRHGQCRHPLHYCQRRENSWLIQELQCTC